MVAVIRRLGVDGRLRLTSVVLYNLRAVRKIVFKGEFSSASSSNHINVLNF